MLDGVRWCYGLMEDLGQLDDLCLSFDVILLALLTVFWNIEARSLLRRCHHLLLWRQLSLAPLKCQFWLSLYKLELPIVCRNVETSNEPNTWKAIKTCFFFDLFLAFCSLMSFCRGARLDERPMPRFSFKAETCPNSWALAIAQHLPIKLVFGLMAIWCNLHQLHHPAVPHPARPPGHVWKLQFVPGSIEVATDATPSPAKLVQLVIKMDETTCWIHHGPSDPDFRFPSPILLDVARLRPHRACLNSMVERIKCALNTDERCCGLKAD